MIFKRSKLEMVIVIAVLGTVSLVSIAVFVLLVLAATSR